MADSFTDDEAQSALLAADHKLSQRTTSKAMRSEAGTSFSAPQSGKRQVKARSRNQQVPREQETGRLRKRSRDNAHKLRRKQQQLKTRESARKRPHLDSVRVSELGTSLRPKKPQKNAKLGKDLLVDIQCEPRGFDIWVDGIKRADGCVDSVRLKVQPGIHKFALMDANKRTACPLLSKKTLEVPAEGLTMPIRLSSMCSDCFVNAETSLVQQGQLKDQDVACLRRIRETSPRWLLAQQMLARSLQDRRRWQQAALVLEEVVKTSRGRVSGDVYAQLAEIYYEAQEYQKALDAYNQAWRYRTTVKGSHDRRTAVMLNLLRVKAGVEEKLYLGTTENGLGDSRRYQRAVDAYRRLRSFASKAQHPKATQEADRGLLRLDSRGGS